MDCPRCGASSPEDAKFCIACGAALAGGPDSDGERPDPARREEAPAPAPPAGPAPASCARCGQPNTDPEAVYCASCGAGLATSPHSPGYGIAAPGSRGSRVCRGCQRLAPREVEVCPHCGGPLAGAGVGGPAVVALVLVVVGMVAVAVVGVLAAILVPNFIRARAQGQITACKSNLKNIGTALEMYSTDNSGRYPTALGSLTPNYLKVIPTCPSAGEDTYTSGYTSSSYPDACTVVCAGTNHLPIVSANYPQYNSTQGLVER